MEKIYHKDPTLVELNDGIIERTNELEFDSITKDIRQYAIDNDVPIIKDEGLIFIKDLIRLKRPLNILEIGTAIGYSASQMSMVTGSNVYTIERDDKMYQEAKTNISLLGLDDKVHLLFSDALEAFDLVKDIKFDMIFIDAAKAQYTKFFNMYTPLLNDNGVVVCDNMLFHGVCEDDTANMTRGLRGLVVKLGRFKDELFNNKDYDTTLYKIGDGMSISYKK